MPRQRSFLALISTHVLATMALSSCVPPLLGQNQQPQPGSQLIIELQKTPEVPQISEREVAAVKKIIENRINGLGISQAVVQTSGADKILVQLPGVTDPIQAERVLGSTAQLEFRKQKIGSEVKLFSFQASRAEFKAKQEALSKTKDTAAITKNQADLENIQQAIAQLFYSTNPPLTGRFLKDAYGEPTQGNKDWNIAITFDQKGGEIFAEMTKNLAGTGLGVGIFIDNQLISAPVVGAEFATNGITGGRAVITGRFTEQQANDLSIQLRAGALPVPVKVKLIPPNS